MNSNLTLSRRQALLGAAALSLYSLPFTSQSQEKSMTTISASTPKRIIFVASNEINPGPAGFPIGYYLTELAHP